MVVWLIFLFFGALFSHARLPPSYELWNKVEAGGWPVKDVTLAYRAQEFALALVEALPADASLLALGFAADAHLGLALRGGPTNAPEHLARAGRIVHRIAELHAGGDPEGKRTARKTAELQFRLHLVTSHVRAEAGESALALAAAASAKELLHALPENETELGVYAYNCGVRAHATKDLDGAIAWLQLSADSYSRTQSAPSVCRSLRMLAACSLDKANTDAAKRAASLALDIGGDTAASLAMMARVHLALHDASSLEHTLSRLLDASDLTLSNAVDLCRELRAHAHLQLELWLLQRLEERFVSDVSRGQARLERMLVVLAMEGSDTITGGAPNERSLQLAEVIVAENLSGVTRLSAPVAAELTRVCFNAGVQLLRGDHHRAAITWIGHALTLLPAQSPDDAAARAQFHRVLCSSYLELDDQPLALSNAESAARFAPHSAASWYMLARCQVWACGWWAEMALHPNLTLHACTCCSSRQMMPPEHCKRWLRLRSAPTLTRRTPTT